MDRPRWRVGRILAVAALVSVGAACGSSGDQAADAVRDAEADLAELDGAATEEDGTGDAPEPPPSTTTTAPPTTTTEAPPTTLPPTTTTTAPPDPTLRQGQEGPEVAAIQARLFELGYRPADVEGHYGAQTASAVMAFQKREGLPRDGVVGLATLERLAAPQGAPGHKSGPGPWIEVDIGRQVAFVADHAGNVTTLNVSTGNGQPYTSRGVRAVANTPRGEWPVYRMVNGVDSGPLGDLYRPLYFTGGYAVHGSPSVPGHPASHGCVRVSNADADWLWDFVGMGAPVWVHD